jgi:proliferating cell nuclear antigen
MKLVLAEPRFLKDPIGIISELVNEVRFNFKENNVEIVAMDPANVSMVVFRLFSSAFIEYDVKKEEVAAINLGNLKEVLKRAKPSDVLSLELKDDKLKVIIKGESTRTFNLGLINLKEGEQKIPDLKFSTRIEADSLLINEAIEDASIVSDAVSFGVNSGKFYMNAEGDLHNALVELSEDVKVDGNDVKAKYAIDYLKKIVKAGKLANSVVIQFDKDYPLKIDYVVKDKLSLSFILAPRVSTD